MLPTVLVDRSKGKSIRGLDFKAGVGRTLVPYDTRVRKLKSGE